MTAGKFTIQHVSIPTGRGFDAFTEAFDAQLGRNDSSVYFPLLTGPDQAEKVEAIITEQAGPSGMMALSILPVGLLFAMEGRPRKAQQYSVGNPLFNYRIIRHDIRTGQYMPLRILIFEDISGNAVVEYDTPTSIFGWFENPHIDAVAKELESKLTHLLDTAAAT